MAQVGHKNRQQVVQPNSAVSVANTNYDAAKYMEVDLPHNVILSVIRLSGTFATTANISIQVSRDAAGDDIVIPDTQAGIAVGTTTATKCVVLFEVETNQYTQGKLYVHAKVNAGTFTWQRTEMYWRD